MKLRSAFLGLASVAVAAVALVPSQAQAAPLSNCDVVVTNLQGINVPTNTVRVAKAATAYLTVDVQPTGSVLCDAGWEYRIPKLGVLVDQPNGGDTVPLPNTLGIPVSITSAGLSNADAGLTVPGTFRFYTVTNNVKTYSDPISRPITVKRYTAWNQTDAYYETGFSAGDTINVRGQLKIADWNKVDASLVAYPGRITRLQYRYAETAYPANGSGQLVKGDSSAISLSTKQLGRTWNTEDATVVLRYAFNGNSIASPSVAVGDAVVVHAQDAA